MAFDYVQWLIEVMRRGKMAKLFDKYNETDAGEFCRIEIDPLPEVGRDLKQKCMPHIYFITWQSGKDVTQLLSIGSSTYSIQRKAANMHCFTDCAALLVVYPTSCSKRPCLP